MMLAQCVSERSIYTSEQKGISINVSNDNRLLSAVVAPESVIRQQGHEKAVISDVKI